MLLVAVCDVDLDSVPGHCALTRLGTTNKQVFGAGEKGFKVENLRLVRTSVLDRYDRICGGETVCDPLKVFIKQEPHKLKKVEEGRLRLICSVSLIDALVDRILFMRLAWRVVENFPKTNIMIGWTPVMGGYRFLETMFEGKKTMSIDKKAWDWSVPRWLLQAIMEVIIGLASDPPEWWVVAVRSRFACLFDGPVFVFPDGSYGWQEKPGVMKSGCYLTILINSIGQLLLHCMAITSLSLGDEAEPIIVLGDDSLQKLFERYQEYVSYLQKLGFRVEYELHDERYEFAGFTFCKDYKPAYRAKHVFNLEHLPIMDREVVVQTLQNYQVLYYFDDEFREFLRNIARTLGMPEAVVGEQRLKAIASG